MSDHVKWAKEDYIRFPKIGLGKRLLSKADFDRAALCVNALNALSDEEIKRAPEIIEEKSASNSAEMMWERLMMELVGEDGPGSVRDAINQMKHRIDRIESDKDFFRRVLDRLSMGETNLDILWKAEAIAEQNAKERDELKAFALEMIERFRGELITAEKLNEYEARLNSLYNKGGQP